MPVPMSLGARLFPGTSDSRLLLIVWGMLTMSWGELLEG